MTTHYTKETCEQCDGAGLQRSASSNSIMNVVPCSSCNGHGVVEVCMDEDHTYVRKYEMGLHTMFGDKVRVQTGFGI